MVEWNVWQPHFIRLTVTSVFLLLSIVFPHVRAILPASRWVLLFAHLADTVSRPNIMGFININPWRTLMLIFIKMRGRCILFFKHCQYSEVGIFFQFCRPNIYGVHRDISPWRSNWASIEVCHDDAFQCWLSWQHQLFCLFWSVVWHFTSEEIK